MKLLQLILFRRPRLQIKFRNFFVAEMFIQSSSAVPEIKIVSKRSRQRSKERDICSTKHVFPSNRGLSITRVSITRFEFTSNASFTIKVPGFQFHTVVRPNGFGHRGEWAHVGVT